MGVSLVAVFSSQNCSPDSTAHGNATINATGLVNLSATETESSHLLGHIHRADPCKEQSTPLGYVVGTVLMSPSPPLLPSLPPPRHYSTVLYHMLCLKCRTRSGARRKRTKQLFSTVSVSLVTWESTLWPGFGHSSSSCTTPGSSRLSGHPLVSFLRFGVVPL